MRGLIVAGLLLVGLHSISAPIIIGYSNALEVVHFSPTVMDQVGRLKWFFAHASVGGNILGGTYSLRYMAPEFYQYRMIESDTNPPPSTQEGIIYHHVRGNIDWQPKIDLFAASVSNGWQYPIVDVVMNKLCYVDYSADVNYYITSMAALEALYRNTWFVYATMPLTTDEDSINSGRNSFNEALRTWVRENNRILFDIADIEAHDTNGVMQTFVFDGKVSQKLFSGFTTDGGHLNTDAGQELAAMGVYAVAGALLKADRDGDQMPDWWEMQNGFDPLNSFDGDADADGDGMTNVKEFEVGTDPNDVMSVLKLNVSRMENGSVQMQFEAASNIVYSIEFCPDLAVGWQSVTNFPAFPTNITISVPVAVVPSEATKLYRLSAHRAL
jgi:hypothetical protein